MDSNQQTLPVGSRRMRLRALSWGRPAPPSPVASAPSADARLSPQDDPVCPSTQAMMCRVSSPGPAPAQGAGSSACMAACRSPHGCIALCVCVWWMAGWLVVSALRTCLSDATQLYATQRTESWTDCRNPRLRCLPSASSLRMLSALLPLLRRERAPDRKEWDGRGWSAQRQIS